MRRYNAGILVLFTVALLAGFTGTAFADHLLNRTPEIQGLVTGTSADVQGTVTETDSGAWITRDNLIFDVFGTDSPAPPYGYGPGALSDPLLGDQAIVTTGYHDNLAAISGQTVFSKSMAINTGNQIADSSNLKTSADLQFIATDTGRATRSEDILMDSAANETDSSDLYVLCPFVSNDDAYFGFPAHCNIAGAGSSIDTTLASVVTSADDRFVGTDSGIPMALDYSVDAKGITAGEQTSPMIGSASAYLKVHTQEARQPNLTAADGTFNAPDYVNSWTLKGQDLAYSETSSANGLISDFGEVMHYQSGFSLI